MRWAAFSVLGVAMRLLGTSAADCGDRLTYGLFRAGAGWTRVDDKGEDVGSKGLYTSEDVNQALWEHTVKETRSVVEAVET
jgi:hypothetical protein